MVKPLRVMMASSNEQTEQLFREVIEGGGHHLSIINPWPSAAAFLEEAGGYDVILLTNLGLPWGFVQGLIAPVCKAGSAKVVVMSGVEDQEDREVAFREGACAFYHLPIPVDKIREAVEAAAR